MENDNKEVIVEYTDVCIVGAGITGMFLASKLLKYKINTILIESSDSVGGQLKLYSEKNIYNIPLIEKISGCELVEKIMKEIGNNSSEKNILNLNTSLIDIIKTDKGFELKVFQKNFGNKIIKCKYLVLSFGVGEMEQNKIKVEGSIELEEKGLLLYSVKNKENFREKDVIISGGGDSAIDWACELCNICKTISIIHRRIINKPENPFFLKFKDLCENGKIKLFTPYNIVKLLVNNEKNNISVNISSTNDKKIINGDYLLAFYGFNISQSKVIDICKKIGIHCHENKILVNHCNETNCSGIFSIGDCVNYNYSTRINNIFMGFYDAMRCFYEICQREHGKIDSYEHK